MAAPCGAGGSAPLSAAGPLHKAQAKPALLHRSAMAATSQRLLCSFCFSVISGVWRTAAPLSKAAFHSGAIAAPLSGGAPDVPYTAGWPLQGRGLVGGDPALHAAPPGSLRPAASARPVRRLRGHGTSSPGVTRWSAAEPPLAVMEDNLTVSVLTPDGVCADAGRCLC
ncbi:unnamed protein product [Merluccius merluccius]